MASPTGPVQRHTPAHGDIDSFIESVVVLAGHRMELEQEEIPPYFWPVTGRWRMKGVSLTFPVSFLTTVTRQEKFIS